MIARQATKKHWFSVIFRWQWTVRSSGCQCQFGKPFVDILPNYC